jgi:hypothetical protein
VVLEPPADRDLLDRDAAHRRVGEIPPCAFQPLLPDVRGHGDLPRLEQAMQMAEGYVVRGGDEARGELRFVQLPLDEGIDTHQQGLLRRRVRHAVLRVQVVPERGDQQIDGHGAEPWQI